MSKTPATNTRRAGRPVGDWDAQRSRLKDTTWEVIRDHGIEGATVRKIAEALGVSTSVVSHYFPNKQALLLFVITSKFEDVDRDLAQAAAISPGAEALTALAEAALPRDGQSRLEWSIYLNFLAQSQRHEDFRKVLESRAARIHELGKQVIRRGQADGSLRHDIDPDLLVDELLAAVEGLGSLAFLDRKRFTVGRQKALLNAIVDRARI